ncbi:glycosyltransferase [Novosphingobium sediminicola]|uniref:Glycosyltransferase involved in cell wall biosynthesis n=1 Tax=Novosphingobium sediminicola TaxID=563162 RepID=A0A7W6G8X3_9SPHN|nr:glycosyltransferase involved in cell wall biosynthesis [Novosphingobium sediminicola]
MKLLSGYKVYDEVRTAHLERAADGPSGISLLYRKASYDFDKDAARKLGVLQVSPLRAFFRIVRARPDCVELNEPLFLRALPMMAACVAGAALSGLLRGKGTRVVTYAIENIDMNAKIASHGGRWGVGLALLLRQALWLLAGRFSRIAFGSEEARSAYHAFMGELPASVTSRVFAAVEPPCPICRCVKMADSVMFLGAFDDRKGIRHLMDAWLAVLAVVPSARLEIIGKGVLAGQVTEWASQRPEVSLKIDPPRADIHDALSGARVLVLPSIGSTRWREQIGLPIVEALSHGCVVVTSPDTGLSAWLGQAGHIIVDHPTDAGLLAEGIVKALNSDLGSADVLAFLPARSGRQQAEEWLWQS